MSAAETREPTDGMVRIPAGEFLMGSEDFYPEEQPVHNVEVQGFWIDEHPVTAAQFRRFVREAGYVTVAERPLDPDEYPDADPELLVPGSLVFRKTPGPVPLNDVRNWWEYVPGASWRKPGDPGTTINGRDHHPVVQVAYEDAEAYATWAGKELDRARVGVRGVRRARQRPLRLGRRALPGRPGDGELLAGRVPRGRTSRSTVSRARPPSGVSRRTPTGSRHVRERLGMDNGRLHLEPTPSRRAVPRSSFPASGSRAR